MSKLQIIKRKGSSILTDTIIDSLSMDKISINNVPYFLTIHLDPDKLRYVFKFIDKPDSKLLNLEDTLIEIGESTGRLYSIEKISTETRLSNKDIDTITKSLRERGEYSSLHDLKYFFKTLQDLNNDVNP